MALSTNKSSPEGWQQAQEALRLGYCHGLAEVPLDLRDAFARRKWTGNPSLRQIYATSANRAVSNIACYRSRLEVAEISDRIGGVYVDEDGDLTEASEALILEESAEASNRHISEIESGPDPRQRLFH